MKYLGIALGPVMYLCYRLTGSYGLGIILFTLLTKVILLPLGILTQKNSIQMVRLMPENDALRIRYAGDKDKLAEEQLALYKRYHYNPFLSIIPLLVQIPLVLGLVYVVYHPLSYVLRIDSGIIGGLKDWISGLLGGAITENSYQNEILARIKDGILPASGTFSGAVDAIRGFRVTFLGINLSHTPSFWQEQILLLIPLLSGVSAWVMCLVQNKSNVLQVTQSRLTKNLTTAFMIAFSTYFAFLVPAGVGLYWIFGNLFSIPSMLLLNLILPPKKHVDYDYLRKMEAQRIRREADYRKYHAREKADYRKFANTPGKELVFYSEKSGFYKYYADILEYLFAHSDIVVHYVTSDPEDRLFTDCPERLIPYYVASDRYLIPLFMRLECKICVMTLADLEKYHIKRSRVKKDIEYIYACHGMGSVSLTLRKGALDGYDTVFCPGPDTFSELREAEELYHTQRKRLVESGYPMIDRMIAEYEASEHPQNARPKILIAPSWQPGNIIESCAEALLTSLSEMQCDIILRPHPQQVKHEPERFELLKERYAACENIEIQTDFSANSPVLDADLLITDWSDISWEYAFVTLRPILYIDTPMKVMNPEYDRIPTKPINIVLRDVLGTVIAPENAADAGAAAAELIRRAPEYREIIKKTREAHVYNIGKSAKLCALYIVKSLKGSL
ncbi:MAG: membrane protein insertase YidC [Lachnospiraceae bacterium]|nr:membrane protein insertase YidC [Lachnospiraceae bacterium]